MSKYIIEIDDKQLLEYDKDTDTYFRTLYRAKGFNALVFDKNGLDKLTPLDKALEEAIEKVKAYEQQKADEIKVGDWVFNKRIGATSSAKVTCVGGQKVYVLYGDGSCGFADMTDLEKTNVRNSKVEQLLEMLKGEQRNCSACKHDGDPRFCDLCRDNDMWQPKEGAE